ncbi:MAG: bifunctional ADP-dependent NAD(P)H-hydrate dehydratase/NAD(P)H-hydrate epimerase, partial [Acidimicrobiaceae bacterium]|nr:bifunctional ADP-dependent NAD(P)H-hydrate dehydratase/NAD(P)H-hydrate epimerase [Acidimicrobiaceae bacterium]
MIPVVTPARMAEIDAAAPKPVDVLIERAGAAVARAAVEMMGGTYGRRVVVLAGPGNNGADGRAAARRLRRRGARVRVISATDAPETLPVAALYIDAAFGTGLSRPYTPPQRGRPDAPVLAVDIPSGLDGLTGEPLGGPVWIARRTVTFAALKPGLLFGGGPAACGSTTVADIGLAVSAEDLDNCALMTDADIESLPAGTGTTHKWHSAALVVAGSPGMGGAAALACEA